MWQLGPLLCIWFNPVCWLCLSLKVVACDFDVNLLAVSTMKPGKSSSPYYMPDFASRYILGNVILSPVKQLYCSMQIYNLSSKYHFKSSRMYTFCAALCSYMSHWLLDSRKACDLKANGIPRVKAGILKPQMWFTSCYKFQNVSLCFKSNVRLGCVWRRTITSRQLDVVRTSGKPDEMHNEP